MTDQDTQPAPLPLSDGAKIIHLRHVCEQAGLMLDDPDKRLAAQRLLANTLAETHPELDRLFEKYFVPEETGGLTISRTPGNQRKI